MGDDAFTTGQGAESEDITLRIDAEGRITISKDVREQLGIECDTEIPRRVTGSVLEIDPTPSLKLEPGTADRDSWENSTPTDGGESLFGLTETPD